MRCHTGGKLQDDAITFNLKEQEPTHKEKSIVAYLKRICGPTASLLYKNTKSTASPSRITLLPDHVIEARRLKLCTDLLETAIFIAAPMKKHTLQFIFQVVFCQFVDKKLVFDSMLKYCLLVRDINKVSLNFILLCCKIKMSK